MKKVKEQPGNDVCHNLLFRHDNLGCDNTSRVYGIGKVRLHFREQAKVFNSPTTVDVVLVSLYGGDLKRKLDGMRYQRYCEKLATNYGSQIQPRRQEWPAIIA